MFFNNKEQYPNIKRFVENNKFMDSNKVYVVIPEGFKGNLSEYSTLLLKNPKMNSSIILSQILLPRMTAIF